MFDENNLDFFTFYQMTSAKSLIIQQGYDIKIYINALKNQTKKEITCINLKTSL